MKLQNLLFLLPLVFACSGGSSDIKIVVGPKTPIVIDADLTYYVTVVVDGVAELQERTIEAPWFAVDFEVTNNNKEFPVSIVSYKLIVTYTGKDGSLGTAEFTLDPGEKDPPALFVQPDILPGKSSSSGLWAVDGLPEADSFTYSVEAIPQGWYGSSSKPKKRLDEGARVFFSTE